MQGIQPGTSGFMEGDQKMMTWIAAAGWMIMAAGMAHSDPCPDPSVTLGTSKSGDSDYTFALHAPGMTSVELVLWPGDTENPLIAPMTADACGTWSITRDLSGHASYRYQYRIDGARYIADPYAGDLEWKDNEGRETWIASNAYAVLHTATEPYIWTSDEYRRPELSNLVIYEFHIDDTQEGGGFTGMIEKLDYIRDLGCNAIQALPLQEFPGDHSWGYNPASHFAPESTYGTPDELRRLIDETRRRGMAFILDIVLNHMDSNGPLYALYGEDIDTSPYFQPVEADNWGFPDLEQSNPAFKRYAADVLRHWLTEYRVDGFRYDATRFTDWSGYNDWGAGWFAYAAKQIDPDAYQIAEHMPSDPALIRETEMDTTWHDTFRWRIRDMIEHGHLDREGFEQTMNPVRLGYEHPAQCMAYTESHDEERVMNHLKRLGYEEDERIRRAITALALPLLTPGPVMIYAGQEFGEDTPKIVGDNPLNWELLETSAGRTIYDAARTLIHAKRMLPALRSDIIKFYRGPLPDNVSVFYRGSDNEQVLAAVNMGREPVVTVFPEQMAWKDLLREEVVEPGEAGIALTLAPGETRILSKIAVPQADNTNEHPSGQN